MKVMLDECITLRCANAVIQFFSLYNPPVEAHFLVTYARQQGLLDADWSQLLQPPEDWIVISADAGRSRPRLHVKGPPLHLILPRLGITSFFLRGKTLTQVGGPERAQAIISKCHDILRCAEAANRGDRFCLRRIGSGLKVEPWPLKGGRRRTG